MRQYKYTGLFKNAEGHSYELQVSCGGFLQAFFLLTAQAISSGKHYQLHTITLKEKNKVIFVADIVKCTELFTDKK